MAWLERDRHAVPTNHHQLIKSKTYAELLLADVAILVLVKHAEGVHEELHDLRAQVISIALGCMTRNRSSP